MVGGDCVRNTLGAKAGDAIGYGGRFVIYDVRSTLMLEYQIDIPSQITRHWTKTQLTDRGRIPIG